MPLHRESLAIADHGVEISRQPGKPLILLTRMASGDGGVWDKIWEPLARCYSVASFGLRMPSTERLDSPADVFRDYARECVEVAAGLGFDRFHILGWNGGTHVALRCAVDFPARLESCILFGPFRELADMRAIHKGIEFMRVMLESRDRELYVYYWFMAGLSPDFVERHFDEVERMVAARLRGDSFVALDVDRIMKWVRALRRSWVSDEELAGIAVPTLVVATELDTWHAGPTVTMAREVHARIPGSRLAVIENAGPLVLLENPDIFMDVAEPFVREVAGGR